MRRALGWFAALALALFAGCAAHKGRLEHSPAGTIRFEGAKTFSEQELLDVIAREIGDLSLVDFRVSAVDDAAYGLEQYYASQGFPFSRVEYKLGAEAGGGARVLFAIEEGPRVRLDGVEIDGAKHFEGSTLRDLIPREEGGLLTSSERWYVKRQINAGASAIEQFYFSSGYLEVVVGEPAVEYLDDSTHARVRISVIEGQRHTLVGVVLEGVEEAERVKLDKDLAGLLGEPFTPRIQSAVKSRIREWYLHAGHPDVKVEITEARRDEDAKRTLVMHVEPGPIVKIAGVRVKGNDKTRGRVVRKLFGIKPQARYDIEEEREGFRQLYQSGLFRTVKVELEQGTGEERWYEIVLEETPSTELYVEPGYGSYERIRLGLGWREKNLFGTGRTLNVESTVSEKALRAQIGLITPRIFGWDALGNTSVFYNRRVEPSFTSEEVGAGQSFTRRFSDRFQATIGYQFRRTRLTDVQAITPQPAGTDIDISSINFTPVYDSRDSLVLPRRGGLNKFTIEYGDAAIGSELDFIRTRFTESIFLPMGERNSLAFSWRAGLIAPIHSSDAIPLQERFFNGGENTVRSFREDEIGPVDISGNPIGGEAFHVFSGELRANLIGPLDGAVFADAGNVELDYTDFFVFHDMRYALGVGLRYVLPVGPIRVDWGFNPDQRDGESLSVLHVSVGMAF